MESSAIPSWYVPWTWLVSASSSGWGFQPPCWWREGNWRPFGENQGLVFLGHAPGRTNPRLVVPKVSKGALRMDQWTQVPLGTSVKHLLSSFIQLVCEFLYQGMSNETMATPRRIAIKQTYHFSETSSTIHLLHAIHVISEAHDKHMVSPRKCNIKLFHPFCNLGQAKLDNSIWRKAKLNILISEHNRLQISFWP